MTMRIKEEIIGKEVVDISGIVIGKVKDVEVNFETQLLETFVIGKGGVFGGLGIGNNETIIPYDQVRIIGDKVLLKNEIHEI
jgi:sporulation protein YlmC with PRC-barrel domain